MLYIIYTIFCLHLHFFRVSYHRNLMILIYFCWFDQKHIPCIVLIINQKRMSFMLQYWSRILWYYLRSSMVSSNNIIWLWIIFHCSNQQPTIHIYIWSNINQDWIIFIFTVVIFYPQTQNKTIIWIESHQNGKISSQENSSAFRSNKTLNLNCSHNTIILIFL